MTAENLELVRSICAEWERGEYRSVGWAHPDIEYVIPDGPAPGRWTGVAGMAQGWTDFLSAWDGACITVDGYHELDQERVLVLFSREGRGKTSGIDLQAMGARGATLFRIEAGQVTRLVLYFDEENALADAGLEAPSARTTRASARPCAVARRPCGRASRTPRASGRPRSRRT